MEVLCYFLARSLLVLYSLQTANGQGVSLEHNGNPVPNFGLLTHSDIDTSDDNTSVGGNLVCRTDLTTCCRGVDGVAQGNWYYPTDDVALFASGELPSGQIYRMRRSAQVVQLRRELDSTITANGIYRCEVADQNGVMQNRYVGLYTEGAGVVSISEDPQFSLISEDLEFTLTSTTTGGPPTTAEWTLPGRTVITAGDGFTQTLLNATTATFEHTLTVTGITGMYTFSTTNTRNGAPDTSSITVQAANPPTGLMAVQNDATSILVSWTAPASGGDSRTGYRIFYQTGGGSVQNVTVGATATSHTLTGLQSGATYSISIEAHSNELPSARVGPETVTFRAFEAPTVMTSVLGPTSIRVTFTQPSGTLAAESYDIQYTRVTGAGQILCRNVQDTNTTTDVQSPFNITNLEEFSSYDITVTARVFSAMRATTEQAIMTSPAVPAAAPRDLVSTTVLSTSITVGWDTVVCIERNGEIANYIVQFGPEGGVQSESTVQSGGNDEAGTYTASGLTPFTNYSFEVAAVNSADTGPFTATLFVVTDGNSPTAPVNLASPSQSPTSITLSWEQPAGDFIDNYIIFYTYQGGCSDYTQPENMATVNDGTAREYTLQNLQEFSGYVVTVTAVNTGGGSTSDVITASTLANAPSGPPQSAMTSLVTSSSITVQWGHVSCIDRNSEITGYTVRYGQTGSTTTVMESVSGTSDSDRVFTASGLIPRTNYTFKVAAVSSEGTGPFSTGTTVETAVPEGIALHLSGQRYGNNSLVNLTAIGEGDTAALLCLTDREQCCRNSDGVAGGDWYYPNGNLVPFEFEGTSIYQNRGASRVRLNRRNDAQSPTGVYRCDVPDASGADQSIYLGVVANDNSEGTPTISSIQFDLTSATDAATPSFTLDCITAGGPVDFNDITWTRAGSSLPANHGLFQVLVNGSTATYNNTLAVTGRETGQQYSCQLLHLGSTTSMSITVEAANPPTGLMAVQDGLTSILVSWTAPAPGGAIVTGYCIFFQTVGGSVRNVTVGAGVTGHTLTTGLQSGATYSISLVALSSTLPSTVVDAEMVTLEEREAPTVMTSMLGPTSIRATFSASNAESYDIQYTRVVGSDQQVCPDNEDTMTPSGATSPYDITNLQEFSSYDITVTAIFPGSTMVPTTKRAMTSPAAPAAAPRDLVNTTVLSTSITVGWDPVECIERNGVIDNYIVRFGPEGGVQNEITVQSEGIGVNGTHTASGLNVSSSYNFSVAAVNSAGIGPFTPPLIVETSVANPPTVLMAVQDGLTSILVSWTAPASDSSVITGYLITYTRTGGSGPQSVTVTGYSTTSRRLSNLESGATYSITIVSLIHTSSSSVEGPVTVTVRVFEAPAQVTAQVLSSTSIKITFTQPSGSLAAASYDIQYTRVTGAGQTLCDSVEDTGATTDVQSPFTITNLEEFSSYDITVTARAFSAMRTTTEQAMTSPAVPSGPPQSVMTSSVTSSSITVQWGRVSCIDRNSEITGYTARYGQTGSTTMANESVSGTSDRIFTASGLIPRTSYTFEVAAVSSEGTGPFSIGITVKTTVPEAIALQLSGQRYGNHSLVTLTDIGEGDTAALLCLTDREQCCRDGDGGGGGNWYFPNGSPVPAGEGSGSIYRTRDASRVRLNRENGAQSPTGVYRCEVPDASGTIQSIYVGVYQQSSGNLTSAAIEYNGTSNTLVCTSTGGPATTVSWRKDNDAIDIGTAFNIFQIITNTTEATYDNVLQLNGSLDDIIGNYSCDVSNIKSTQDAAYTIQGLQISGHEATLQLGESYSITCTTDLEVATIEWLDSATMEPIKVGNSSPLILELQSVESTMNGASYTCRTTSPHGMQERSITLTVELRSSTSDSPVGVAVGAVVGIGLVLLLLLLLAVVLWCIIYRKKRRGKFTLFDRVRSKRGRKSQSYGVPYDVRGSGIDGAMELKGVGEEEEEGKDDDYFEDSAALAMDRKRPIPLSEFGAHVQRMHNDREKKFELEFDSLIKHPQFSVDIAQIPVNRDRNRFGNIFPYNTNRVTLNEIPGVNGSDYINASYIEGYNNTENAYIAAQGPLPNSIDDFWRMIWEQKLSTVVMLTKCFEGKAKCEKYWPENLESTLKLKNNLVISMTEVLPFTEYEIRKLKVQDTSKPSEPPLALTQLHYTIWPDHGAPGNAMSVINFIKRVRRVHPISSSTRAPLLVHCSAGVGRTGTFIVLDVMLQRIKDVDNVNVYAFITELRTQRVFMVQSLSQYVFIHDAIDELITCGESEIAAANIRITINRLTAFGVGGMTGFQQQFQNLQQVSPKAKDVDFKVGRSAQNVSKNRYQENVVSDLTRVRVSPAGSGCSDYINAVFVEGYRKRGAYISTQGPMEETVSDFWRMVWEYQSKCIVMLCKLEENGEESCYCYWPTQNGASAVYGKLKVTLRSQETCMDYVVRKLEVTDDKQHPGLAADGGSRFVVTQFQFSRWSPTATPATFALLEVVDKMTKVQMTSGNKAITVMCNDGVGRTGAFITVHTQLERLKTEGMVDVFQSIKSARIQRAGLVQSVEQYIFCHNALEDFLDSFETYANFKELV